MVSSVHRLLIVTSVLALLLVQVHAGYWVCDWVHGRGWMYCSRGFCNTFGRKRRSVTDEEQTGPIQNHDATYCLNAGLCYTCEAINDRACRITLQPDYVPIPESNPFGKRSDEDICA